MELSAPVIPLKDREGAFLINLPLFRGNTSAILDRIPPATSGIYAWFRHYQFSDDDQVFLDELIAEVEKPKFYPRTGHVRPYFGVRIESHSRMSDLKKRQLRAAFEREGFVSELRASLQASLLFQTPLYIGKSRDLRRRVDQHLSPTSDLRNRLRAVSTELEATLLLLIPVQTDFSDQVSSTEGEDFAPDDPTEDVYEEVFSRLFLPQFTIRLG